MTLPGMFLALCTLLNIGYSFSIFNNNVAVDYENGAAYCLAGSDPKTGAVCFPLMAAQHFNVGHVCVTLETVNDVTYVRVTTTTKQESSDPFELGWVLEDVKFWLSNDLGSAVTTNAGNPIPGRFPYTCEVKSGISCSSTVPLSDLFDLSNVLEPCNKQLWLSVHADVQKQILGDYVLEETAWGNGTRYTDRGSWGMYNHVEILCNDDCSQPDKPPTSTCETAFARDDVNETSECFLDSEFEFNRWGWTSGPLTYGTYKFSIWAAAGQCDLSKGQLVGVVTLTYQQTKQVTVEYEMLEGYHLTETHVYVGNSRYPIAKNGNPTVAPGQYPHIHSSLDNVEYDVFVIQDVMLSDQIYLIAHGVVCN